MSIMILAPFLVLVSCPPNTLSVSILCSVDWHIFTWEGRKLFVSSWICGSGVNIGCGSSSALGITAPHFSCVSLYCDLITFWHVTKLQVLWGLSEWRAHLIWANLFIPERFGVTSVQSPSSPETSLRRLKAKEKSLQETAFCRCQNTWTQGWVTAAVKVACLWFKSLTKYFMKKKQWLGAYWIYINRSALQY